MSDVSLGRHITYWFEKTPRRLLYYLSYYQFAARMIGVNKRILDIGCSEGMGTWLLANACGFAQGIDFDQEAIAIASNNWCDSRIQFVCGDFFQQPVQSWDAIVSFDVIEHIFPENISHWWEYILNNLPHNGLVIMGTPNQMGQQYASEISKAGHVNIYSAERLEEEMRQYFKHVFMFAANDEVVHTGFMPMAHYLIAIGCQPHPKYLNQSRVAS